VEKTEPISTLKHLCCRKDSFQKLPQFSQGINVLDAPAYTTNGVISRQIFVTSMQLIGIFGTK
jgi:hypothetical protein